MRPASGRNFLIMPLGSASGEQTPHVTAREGLYRVRMLSRNPDRLAKELRTYDRPALRNCFASFPADPKVATASLAVATVVSM